MSGLARRREATCEDFLALPDDAVVRIDAGDLHATPRPAIGHQLSVAILGGELVPSFRSGHGVP